MKSEQEIKRARDMVSQTRIKVGQGSAQDVLLAGMSVALCWVMGSKNGSTLQRLLDGELVQSEPLGEG